MFPNSGFKSVPPVQASKVRLQIHPKPPMLLLIVILTLALHLLHETYPQASELGSGKLCTASTICSNLTWKQKSVLIFVSHRAAKDEFGIPPEGCSGDRESR